jgi:uncharacterized protein YdcH (DUF465 family)
MPIEMIEESIVIKYKLKVGDITPLTQLRIVSLKKDKNIYKDEIFSCVPSPSSK